LAEQDPTLEGADNPERPEWLPENFKSPEALVDSYKELQGASTRTSQQLAEERQAREALEEAVQTLSAQFEAANRPDPANVVSQWRDQWEEDPFNTSLTLMQQIAQNTAQQVLQAQAQQSQRGIDPTVYAAREANNEMAATYEDWAEYAPKVREVLEQTAGLYDERVWERPETTKQAIENIYKSVKAEDMLTGNSVIQQQVADTRAMKLAAQSAAGASGRSPAPDDFEQRWQEIQNAQSGKLGL